MKELDNELGREAEENYSDKMTIMKDKEFEELKNTRFQLEVNLQQALIGEKEAEIKTFKEGRAAIREQFEKNAELQTQLREEAELRKLIENSLVQLDLLLIQVKELEDATEYLNEKKEELLEMKRLAEVRNEELLKELAVKEEIAGKRLQAKLNRDKNVEVKELIAQEETAVEHNTELGLKLEEEKKKYEGLLDEKLELAEKLVLATGALEELKGKRAN